MPAIALKGTVNYNSDGGTPASSTSNTTVITANAGETIRVTVPITSTRPTKTGYTFNSWGGYSPGSSITLSVIATGASSQETSTTLTASWTRNVVRVTYDKNTTDTVTNMPEYQTHYQNTSVTLRTNVPERANYRFLGWSQDASAIVASYQPGGTYNLYNYVTLYAVWEPAGVIYTKVNGTWKKGRAHVKVNGTWKAAQTVWVKSGGTWKSITS